MMMKYFNKYFEKKTDYHALELRKDYSITKVHSILILYIQEILKAITPR